MVSITEHLDFSPNHKRRNGKQNKTNKQPKKEIKKQKQTVTVYNFTTG